MALRDQARAERQADDPVELIWLGDLWGVQIVSDVMMAVDAFAALPASIRDLARLTIVGFGDCWGGFKEIIAHQIRPPRQSGDA